MAKDTISIRELTYRLEEAGSMPHPKLATLARAAADVIKQASFQNEVGLESDELGIDLDEAEVDLDDFR